MNKSFEAKLSECKNKMQGEKYDQYSAAGYRYFAYCFDYGNVAKEIDVLLKRSNFKGGLFLPC